MWIILCDRQNLNNYHCHTTWKREKARPSSLTEYFSSKIFPSDAFAYKDIQYG